MSQFKGMSVDAMVRQAEQAHVQAEEARRNGNLSKALRLEARAEELSRAVELRLS